MSDLDDFFAKKDKKRKNKKSFSKANTDILAKNLEEQKSKELAVEDSEKAPLATTIGNQNYANKEAERERGGGGGGGVEGVKDDNKDDDEWLEYTPDKKDYSNLKIEALKIEEEIKEEEDEEHEINEDGEKVKVKKDHGGPWNKVNNNNHNAQNENEQDEDDSSSDVKAESAPAPATPSTSYIPPGKRNLMSNLTSSSPASSSRGSNRRNKTAPDINSQVYFPSLSSSNAPAPNDDSSRQNFEEVRSGGGSYSQQHKAERPGLTLDNKFSALRD